MKKRNINIEKKKKIADSFYNLILNKDYNDISINDIRKKSGIALGTIYYHFPEGKLAIIKYILIKLTQDEINLENFLLIGTKADLKGLKSFIANLISVQKKYGSFYRGVMQTLITEPQFFKKIPKISKEYYLTLIEKMQKESTQYKNLTKEEIFKSISLIKNTLNAYISRHLYIEPIFDTDEELINFLAKLIQQFIDTNFEIIS